MSGQLLWSVAFVFYIYDSISLRDRDAVLRYSIDGVEATIVAPAFTFGARRIFIPNPLRPDFCDLLLTEDNEAELSPVEHYFIRRASWMYLVHQFVAIGCLLLLFVLTPLLATRMNLLHACLISVAATYCLCGVHLITFWKNRRLLGVDGKAIRSEILHLVLCPPNAVNCARRVAALRSPRFGVLTILRAFSRYDAEKYEQQFRLERGSA